MESLRLKNFRKFSDTGDINLKPLTLLVGANSSGKSSFLKFFPLVKQTVRRHANGVFLWYSDDVDFKDFNNTVKEGEKEIEINFNSKTSSRNNSNNCSVSLVITELNGKKDYLKSFSIKLNDIAIELIFPSNTFQKGKVKIIIDDDTYEIDNCSVMNFRPIIPTLLFEDGEGDGVFERPYSFDEFKKIAPIIEDGVEWRLRRAFQDRGEIRSLVKSNLSPKAIESIENWREIENGFIIYNINRYLESVGFYLEALAENITYIQPLRAMAERYYRIQNIAIDEIDSHGDNLAMFLHSLEKDKQAAFSEWLEKRFNFKLTIQPNGGHIELLVEEPNKHPKNMVDVGFGYSQMLPILASIWNSLCKKQSRRRVYPGGLIRRPNEKLIVIEQPELHLHPRFISLFARMILSLIKEYRDVKFIIETHSETVINTIGTYISQFNDIKEEDKVSFSEEDVSIVLFNADEEGYNTQIIQTGYDSDGYLKEWPYGFFSGDVY